MRRRLRHGMFWVMVTPDKTALLARLQGRLAVLLGMRDELRAIGACETRRVKNRAEIARLRAELARALAETPAISPMRLAA